MRTGFGWLSGLAVAVALSWVLPAGAAVTEPSFKAYLAKAKAGDAWAQTVVGYYFDRKADGDDASPNRAEALRWFALAAAQKQEDAEYELGLAYRDGKGVAKDETKGMALLTAAAKQGQGAAMSVVSNKYPDVPPPNGIQGESEYMKWKAAYCPENDTGDRISDSFCAVIFPAEDHVDARLPDLAADLVITLEKANAGDVDAQRQAGQAFRDGEGTLPDTRLALKWYGRAAKAGDADDQLALADLYYEGADPALAMVWYGRAADQNNSKAMLHLAKAYFAGRGTPRNVEKAADWAARVARRNDDYDYTPLKAQILLSEINFTRSHPDYRASAFWLTVAQHHLDSMGGSVDYLPDPTAQEEQDIAAREDALKGKLTVAQWKRIDAQARQWEEAIGLGYDPH
jgi:TPR repeat protein